MSEVTAETGKVYRPQENARTRFPIILMMQHEVHSPGDPSSLTLVEIHEQGRVRVIDVDRQDKCNVKSFTATPGQVDFMAQAAFRDLGVVHPGVAGLLNFAAEIGA